MRDVHRITDTVVFCLCLTVVVLGVAPDLAAVHANGDPKAGRAIYMESCIHCHGPTGRGDSDLAQYLTPPPANLASQATQSKSDDELRKVIIEGRQGTAMAGFEGTFGDRELIDIIAFIRSLKP